MLRRWSSLPLRNADAGAGSGGGAAEASAAAPAADAGAVAASATQAAAPPRPDWLPEDQWDATAGKPKFDVSAVLQSHQQAAERAAQVPADPSAYKAELPADLKLPEGVKFEPAADDPLLIEARTWAKENGLSQAQFSQLLGLWAKMEVAAHEAATNAAKAEKAALGAKADERIGTVTTFLKTLPADQFEALKGVVTSAKAVEAIENLMTRVSGQVLPGSGAQSGEPNPWAKDTFNLTKQGQMLKSNPEQAKRLMAAAGVKA